MVPFEGRPASCRGIGRSKEKNRHIVRGTQYLTRMVYVPPSALQWLDLPNKWRQEREAKGIKPFSYFDTRADEEGLQKMVHMLYHCTKAGKNHILNHELIARYEKLLVTCEIKTFFG